MKDLKGILSEVVETLKSDENILSVSLIGSATTKMESLEKVSDIDLFVVKETSNGFEREVRVVGGKEFDISYIDVDDLNKLIIKDNHFWINILSRAKHLFKRNTLIEGYFQLANKIYVNGPTALTENEVKYLRFKLTKKLEDLEYRLDKPVAFQYLCGVYLPEMLTAYFRMQNTWVPRDKKLMDLLFDVDTILYELVKASYKAETAKEHLHLIDDIVIYILKPYGGKLAQLERCHLPIYE
jgi:predicted nucleotidyltransferase